MATNPYINQAVTSEQSLYQDLIIESIQFYGQDVYYLPREILATETILSDEVVSRYSKALTIEVYPENVDGWDGEGDLFTKFGIEIRSTVNLVIARKRWYEEVRTPLGIDSDTNYRPKEGDLIFIPMSQNIFQIMRVDDETPFYQLKNLPVFRLTCELFEYGNEDFDTGIAEIDKIDNFSYQYRITMDSSATGYIVGELVTQANTGYNIRGEVIYWDSDTSMIYLDNVGADDGMFHGFSTSNPLVGDSSSASYIPQSITEYNGGAPTAMNDVFSGAITDIIDFTESNPFGEPS